MSALLSICIPTYNRAIYLQRLLDSLMPQIESYNDEIEVIISDNASTDGTIDLCSQYALGIKNLTVLKNEENKGPDYNISRVYMTAIGRFVWVLGDDEYLRSDAIANVILLLRQSSNCNLIYLNSQSVDGIATLADEVNEEISFMTYNSNVEFSRDIGVKFTFISGVIVNKYKVGDITKLIDRYQGTNLVQLSWVFTALKMSGIYAYVYNKYVFSQRDNSGGYKLYTVFGKNLSGICSDFFQSSRVSYEIKCSAMFFLLSYLRSPVRNNFNSGENVVAVMNDSFCDLSKYRYLYRWFFVFPKLYLLISNIKSKIPSFRW